MSIQRYIYRLPPLVENRPVTHSHISTLHQQTASAHLTGLLYPHGLEHRRRHITQHAVRLLETPSRRRIRHDERHFIRRVRRLGFAVLVEHFLRIAITHTHTGQPCFLGWRGEYRTERKGKERSSPMIGRQKENIPAPLTRLVHGPDGPIRRGAPLDRRLIHTRMSHHVRRREIVHQEVVTPAADAFAQPLGHARGAHLGVFVVRGYLGRGDQVAFFAGELFLDAAVEEEGDVGVFLGLRHVVLLEALDREPLGEDVGHDLGREGDGVGELDVVARHCGEVDVVWVGEVRQGASVEAAEELGRLADAIAAVVEVEDGVVVVDAASGAVEDDGFEEFVGFVFRVARFDGCDGVGAGFAFAGDQRFQADFDPLPAFVSVHDVVSSYYGREFSESDGVHVREEGFEVADAAFGIGIPPVTEEVDIYFRDLVLFGDFEQSEEMVDVTMNAPVADEAAEVQSAVPFCCVGEALADVFNVLQLPLFDCLVDADHILPDHPPGADIQVPDLRVAHEALG